MRIKKITKIKLENPVKVYDLEIDSTSNFCLANGCVVHNSKDGSDAVAGSVWTAKNHAKEFGNNVTADDFLAQMRGVQSQSAGRYSHLFGNRRR